MRLFILRVEDSGVGIYNAHCSFTCYVIADSVDSAISMVLNSKTCSVEVLGVHDFISIPNNI